MEKTISFYLAYIYKGFLAYSSEELKKIGVNYGQLPFIIYIGKKPGCSLSDIKGSLRMDWGHSQRVIERLKDNDIVSKSIDSNDKRICHLYLTKKGEEAFKVAHEVFSSWDKKYLIDLNEEEKNELYSLLKRLAKLEEGFYELQ